MTKPQFNRGRFFEDFKLGENIVHATPRTITEGDAALYIALTGSRHIVHCAQPVAHSLGLEDKTIDDLLAFHIAFGKSVPDISVNAVANLGYAEIKFQHPVYAGDTLTTETEVIGLKQNSSGKNGIVFVRSTSFNHNRKPVLSWVRWVMVHKNNMSAPAPETVIPELDQVVAVEDLMISEDLDTRDFDTAVTGSGRLWEDFEVGERLNHPAGMTVDDSDHTLATKLYQNNARLHFDDLAMQDTAFGRRLMYGGHVISICRALSYDGLENALFIAAINAGTHANPSFGGDTFYSWSEVLEKWPMPGRDDLGALRLRMVGLKNQSADSLASTHVDIDGKRQYHPNVVLDLDYTVLMPRQA
ncbi:MaoC family dehydratase [uncultured Methylophaga sp.]|uniref:MaoC family dehydratase n=1 Tax=uncultured Methylophaga sp. TaxID=285271 RepID=UPI0026244C7E|nr:MaoC family dehydratase [uncultured Methylophaga sp.]